MFQGSHIYVVTVCVCCRAQSKKEQKAGSGSLPVSRTNSVPTIKSSPSAKTKHSTAEKDSSSKSSPSAKAKQSTAEKDSSSKSSPKSSKAKQPTAEKDSSKAKHSPAEKDSGRLLTSTGSLQQQLPPALTVVAPDPPVANHLTSVESRDCTGDDYQSTGDDHQVSPAKPSKTGTSCDGLAPPHEQIQDEDLSGSVKGSEHASS
jgi:hypothetical protein